jgi:ABC-type transport system involved in multi-copper enzyme maturation permease subunit
MGESRARLETTERPSPFVYFCVKVYSVAANTFIEGVRQPVYAAIVGSAAVMILVSPYITMFTLMLAGLLVGAFTASNVISQEIDNRTVLTVISKPVGRSEFILGKFLGVMAGLIIAVYLLSLSLVLTVSGGALEADLETELSIWIVLSVFGCMFLAVCYGLYHNFFHDRPFASRAIGAVIPLLTICFIVFGFVDTRALKDYWGAFGKGINLDVVRACIMCSWAILLMAAFAVAVSTRLSVVVNVAVSSGMFLLGLLSQYLFVQLANKAPKLSFLAGVLYAFIPNLQVFWVSDTLNAGLPVPLILVIYTGVYAFFFISAFLFLGMLLFQERQVA